MEEICREAVAECLDVKDIFSGDFIAVNGFVRRQVLPVLDYGQLKEILPHAYPFLLIDKVMDYKKDDYLIAVKNITANEWPSASFLKSEACLKDANKDYPLKETGARGRGIFPGTLLIEAAAQAALVLYALSGSKKKRLGSFKYLFGKAEATFTGYAEIGDQLTIKAFPTKFTNTGGYSNVKIFVQNRLLVDANLIIIVKNVIRDD